MLTPNQIKVHSFQQNGRGLYKSSEVDQYFDEVVASYEQMFRENGELVKKIGLLADKVEEYRKDEDNLRMALLTAQRMAEQITREAKDASAEQLENAENAANELKEASEAAAQALINEATEKARNLTEETEALTQRRKDESEFEAQNRLNDAEYRSQNMIDEAQKKSDLLVRTAEAEAARVTEEARMKVYQETLTFEMLKKEISDFRTQVLSKYDEHLQLLSEIPSVAERQVEKGRETTFAFKYEEVKAEETKVEEAVEEEPIIEEAVEEEPIVEEVFVEEEIIEEEPVVEEIFEEVAVEEPIIEEVEEAVPERVIYEAPEFAEEEIEEPAKETVEDELSFGRVVYESPEFSKPEIEKPVVEEIAIEEPVAVADETAAEVDPYKELFTFNFEPEVEKTDEVIEEKQEDITQPVEEFKVDKGFSVNFDDDDDDDIFKTEEDDKKYKFGPNYNIFGDDDEDDEDDDEENPMIRSIFKRK